MPFRYHCTNPDTGKYEYLWVDEVSHIMIHGDDASRESMRDAAQNFSIEIMHFQLMAILADGLLYGYRILRDTEVDQRILDYLKMSPKVRYRDTSYRILYNHIVKPDGTRQQRV